MASLHTQERLWRRNFCNGAKLPSADLESGVSHIAGADPNRFPPFYGNRSDFHKKRIFNNNSSTFQVEIRKMVYRYKCFLFPVSGH